MGGRYVNQLLMVKLIRQLMPTDWKLYVKEHLSQYTWFNTFGDQYRSSAFYEEISKLPNTILVPLTYDTYHLIDGSKAVATITGSVGFEAVVRNKPVLLFGHPWYKGCSGVLESISKENLQTNLTKIMNGYKPNPIHVLKFLYEVQQHSFPGVVGGKIIQKQAGVNGEDELNSEGHILAIQSLLNSDE